MLGSLIEDVKKRTFDSRFSKNRNLYNAITKALDQMLQKCYI